MKKIANYQVSLKAILKNSAGETLVLKQPENTFQTYGKYDFPGGRIDTDEFDINHLDILAREIKEELGNNIKYEIKNKVVAIGRHKNSSDTVFYVVFEGLILNESIEISFEHMGFEFIKLEEVDLDNYFKSGMLQIVKMYLGR